MADIAAAETQASNDESGAHEAGPTETATGARLRSFIERIERLEEEKKALADDIKEVYSEAKGQGFDTKTMRKIVSLRKKDPDDRAEEDALLDTYLSALGMA
ncbi:MAG: DUF2312 domain-containing protein [Alphaproteobacteria bacterium]